MKFKIFTLQEIVYIWVSYLVIIGITVGSIFIYLKNSHNDQITFTISIFYALFLFVVGTYMNNMSSKTQNLLYRRKKQYLNLTKLYDMYSSEVFGKNEDKLFSFIIMNKGFTGRFKEKDKKIKPYIQQDGFSFKPKYIHLEEFFLEEWGDLKSEWNEKIKKYVEKHEIKTKVPYIHINYLEKFLDNVDNWINEYLDLTQEQKNDFNTYVEKLNMEYRTRYKNYEITKKKLIRINNKIKKKANRNLLRLERVYGEMLTEAINSEYDLLTNLEVIENLIKKLEEQTLTYDEFHETHGENIEELQDKLGKLDNDLANVSEKVEDILLEVND